ncbi:hypothetical protein [Candidatus Synechococcus spongiarum]|nr:hypothetical protein [Candidatus Synechococcus spongiarum]
MAEPLPDGGFSRYYTSNPSDFNTIGWYHGDSPSGTPELVIGLDRETLRFGRSMDSTEAASYPLWKNVDFEIDDVWGYTPSYGNIARSTVITVYNTDPETGEALTGDRTNWASFGWWMRVEIGGGTEIGALFDGSHYQYEIDLENLPRDFSATYRGHVLGRYVPNLDTLAGSKQLSGNIDLGIEIHAGERDGFIGTATGKVHSMTVGVIPQGDRVINLGTAGIVPDGSWERRGEDSYWSGSLSDELLDGDMPTEAGGTFRQPFGTGGVVGAYLAGDCAQADCKTLMSPN